MKKLFLILVSVLLLGGCSVDDDISVSGGGVSNGGDDMSITTYPNVVEASRTVVEGGYLVDYVGFDNGLNTYEVTKIICQKLKLPFDDLYEGWKSKIKFMFDFTGGNKADLNGGKIYGVFSKKVTNRFSIIVYSAHEYVEKKYSYYVPFLVMFDEGFKNTEFYRAVPLSYKDTYAAKYSYDKDIEFLFQDDEYAYFSGVKGTFGASFERFKFTIFEPSN